MRDVASEQIVAVPSPSLRYRMPFIRARAHLDSPFEFCCGESQLLSCVCVHVVVAGLPDWSASIADFPMPLMR